MKQNKTQLYRHPHKTPQSRSIQITLNFGFTLIELLVVISIIALISTIVFGAMGDARAKARNTAKNNLVLEYVKALELYRNDNSGSYPTTAPKPPLGNPVPVCIGYSDGEPCFWNRFGSTNLINALQNYFPEDFSHRLSIIINNNDYKGVIYTCPAQNNTCYNYSLVWVLEKQVSECISNSQTNPDFSGNTYCTYPKPNQN